MSNSTSRTEFVLSTEGKIIQRVITESEKELAADQLNRLAEQKVIFRRRVLSHPQAMPITLGLSKDIMTMTAELKTIRIKTNYTMHEDALVPAFDQPSEPMFDIIWMPPEDMKVYFVVELGAGNSFIAAHLPAIDAQNRCHRLPLGNLYETGQICLGKEFGREISAMDSFNSVFEQFDKSQWNNDLQLSNDRSIIRKLFRFQIEGDGFRQLDATGVWHELCPVIAPPILRFIKL